MALLVGVEVLEPTQGLEDRMIICRLPGQTHERAQQCTHGTNAIDKAPADKLGTARRPARSMLSEKRVQALADLRITGRRLCENRVERCQQLLVQQRPITIFLGIAEFTVLGHALDLGQGFQDPVIEKAGERFERVVALARAARNIAPCARVGRYSGRTRGSPNIGAASSDHPGVTELLCTARATVAEELTITIRLR